MPYKNVNVLSGMFSSKNIIQKKCFIDWETKNNACLYPKTMEKSVNPALHAQVVVVGIAIEVAELKRVPLQSKVLKGCDNIDIHKDRPLELN